MSKNYANNISDEARKRGAVNSVQRRAEKRNARRAQVKIMLDAGLSKSEIARRCGVHYETIRSDIAAIQHQHQRQSFSVSIVDAIFQAVRKEIAGEITTLEAREEVEKLIDLAIELKNEKSDENAT